MSGRNTAKISKKLKVLNSENIMTEEADKIFLEYVVKALVDNPNDIKIERTLDEMGVLISLTVNPADMGKIIGRMGNTAKAIRTLLRIIGMKNNARVNLKINEPEGSMRPERSTGSMGYVNAAPTLKTVDQAMEDLKGI
ncbi:MAG: KH domain-containing protein [bacterium]